MSKVVPSFPYIKLNNRGQWRGRDLKYPTAGWGVTPDIKASIHGYSSPALTLLASLKYIFYTQHLSLLVELVLVVSKWERGVLRLGTKPQN